MNQPAVDRRARVRGLVESTQFRYLVAGMWNTAFGFLVFAGLWALLGSLIGYGVILLIAQVIAIVQAHWAQRRFVWRSSSAFLPELARFGGVYIAAYFVNLGLLALCVEVMGWPVLPSQMGATVVIVAATYVVNRVWTFKHAAQIPDRDAAL